MAERPVPRRRHRREPLTAASAVARFRRRAGGRPGTETGVAAAAWADVVGAAAAAHSVPVRRTRAGVLTIACSSASWAQELTMRRDDLLERLLARAPDAGVTALRFSVGDHALAAAPEAPPPPRPAPRPTRAQAALGARAAEGLADERLRDLVARAAAASAARRATSSDT